MGDPDPALPVQWNQLEAVATWVHVTGPTATLLWSTMVRQGDYLWDLHALGRSHGVTLPLVWRSLQRLVRFKVAHWVVPDHTLIVAASTDLPNRGWGL